MDADFFEALQLHTLCKDAPPPPPTPQDQQQPPVLVLDHASENGSIYVKATTTATTAAHADPAGSKVEDGTFRYPYSSVAKAVATAILTSPPKPVLLQDGIHYLKATLELGTEHNGLHISAAPGANAWLSGGVELKPQWSPAPAVPSPPASPLAASTPHNAVFVAKVAPKDVPRGIKGLYSISSTFSPNRFTRARYSGTLHTHTAMAREPENTWRVRHAGDNGAPLPLSSRSWQPAASRMLTYAMPMPV